VPGWEAAQPSPSPSAFRSPGQGRRRTVATVAISVGRSNGFASTAAKAASTLRAVAQKHPSNVEVQLQLAEVLKQAGKAPEALAALPDPDRVFVGGGGLDVLESVMDRLRPGGLVVATYAALDRAAAAANRLGHVVQVAVSRGVHLGGSGALRLAAENPVFVCWGPGGDDDGSGTTAGSEAPA